MAEFEVVITRETVEELKFIVEAPSLKSFEKLEDDEIYEAADGLLGGLKAWKIVENGIDVLLRSVKTHKLPKLVLLVDAKDGEDRFKKYELPKKDPRQMLIPGTEK